MIALDIRDAAASRQGFAPRALVLDLDGTCLDREVRLHPRIRAAVRAASLHLPVIVATGRMYASALPWARELGIQEPLVCYQGALVREMPGDGSGAGQTLFERPLGAPVCLSALRAARDNDWHLQVYQDDELLCERDRPEARMYSRIAGMPFRVVPDLSQLLAAGSTKLACVVTAGDAETQRCVTVMTRALGDAARVTRSLPEFVEIVNPLVSKAVACEVVCARLGFGLADTVAIGDAPNDIEMLNGAGFAIVVASARPDVLATADATCAPPEDGGVADALEVLMSS